MEPDETSESASYYTSSYTHGVDEKRRVAIPAKWRPPEAGTVLTLILWPSSEGTCLRVLPPKQMARLMRDIELMPNADPKKVVLKRLIGAGSEQVALDKAGRICLPEPMAREAALTDEVTLVGSLDRFEIWNPERYNKVKIADAMMAAEALKLLG